MVCITVPMTGVASPDSEGRKNAPNVGDVDAPSAVTGIVLAAGGGSRMGVPKALVVAADGTPWLSRASTLLVDAGCDPVLVVLGARADEAQALLPGPIGVVRPVIAEDWADGMAQSLRAGLTAAAGTGAGAALITLVDLPNLPLALVRRVLDAPFDAATLRQAVHNGKPGHPVLVGRDHWRSLASTLTGDHGARGYLVAHGVTEVECADLFDGHDVDTAADAAAAGATSTSTAEEDSAAEDSVGGDPAGENASPAPLG
jgi:CTP:molybdopterin cytidylyltransferase MocA